MPTYTALRNPWIRRGVVITLATALVALAVWATAPSQPTTPSWPQRQAELIASSTAMIADYTRTAEGLDSLVESRPAGDAVAAATATYFHQLAAAARELRDATAAADSFPETARYVYDDQKLHAESVLRKRLSVITALAAREGQR
jgi:hypothetical protein